MSLLHPFSNHHRSAHMALIKAIFAADGALDTNAFLALLKDDVRLRIGSQAPLAGREAVRAAIDGVFAMMRSGLDHHLIASWESDDTVVYEAEVTYRLKGGRDVMLPYTNVLRLDGSKIHDYRIYIDLSPLQISAA